MRVPAVPQLLTHLGDVDTTGRLTGSSIVWDGSAWVMVDPVGVKGPVVLSAPALAFGAPTMAVAAGAAQGQVAATVAMAAPPFGFGGPTTAITATVVSPVSATVTMTSPAAAFGAPAMSAAATVSGANNTTVTMSAPALAFGAPRTDVAGGPVPADVLTSDGTGEPLYSDASPSTYLTQD